MANDRVTINGVNREIDSEWVTIDGIWRKVDKSSVTVNGVWREAYTSFDTLIYAGPGSITVTLSSDSGVPQGYNNFAGFFDITKDMRDSALANGYTKIYIDWKSEWLTSEHGSQVWWLCYTGQANNAGMQPASGGASGYFTTQTFGNVASNNQYVTFQTNPSQNFNVICKTIGNKYFTTQVRLTISNVRFGK